MRFAQVTEAQLRAFKQTANAFRAVGVEARHGPKVTPPAAPMSMTDATALVIHIIESWLAERKARLG
jgi:hypothetical protein